MRPDRTTTGTANNTLRHESATGRRASARLFGRPESLLFAALIVVGLVRLATLGSLALTDNTEARYASIGWQMFQSGDWVTPRVYLGGRLVPFMAKPPLFFWMTALSFQVCGASEWGARLPNFLLGVLVVTATVWFGRRFWGPRVGALAGLILASSGLFFVLAGSCVLDMALAASICMGMMSFALFAAEEPRRRRWGLLFFLSLGLGCLAKGPVAVVLVGLGVGTWMAASSQSRLLRRLPWASGLLIAAVVAAPWYALAQRATPEFLYYFLVQEHVLRYLRSEYGDLYGSGHVQPYGASWVMLLITFLPWPVLMVRWAFGIWRRGRDATASPRDTWLWYALIWGLTPAVFFTFCRQILVTYLLPGFPGLALAASVVVVRWVDSKQSLPHWTGLRVLCLGMACLLGAGLTAEFAFHTSPWLIGATLIGATAFCALYREAHARGDSLGLLAAAGVGAPLLVVTALNAAAPWINESFSARPILEAVARLPDGGAHSIVLPFDEGYSADFYQVALLGGRLERPFQLGPDVLVEMLREPSPHLLVLRRKNWQEIGGPRRQRLAMIAETPHWVACRARSPQRSADLSARVLPRQSR